MPNARYVLSVDCPVKWTAAQGRSVSNDYPFADIQASTSAEFVQRRYLDFLWLPESISPLRCLIPTLLRAADQTPSTSEKHPLHGLLQPILLTPRLASQKYHSRISQILEDDSGTGDVEENMIWFALKYEKADEEEAAAAQGDFDADDRWKHEWLARMERREVQIQILLHFLLLSLPGAPKPPVELTATELSPHLSSPKKRKRKRSASPPPRILSLEECLELFMDKMSMWQLMTSLETDDDKRNVQHSVNTKGKKKSLDERDWMQAFCEDVIEKQFKDKLPELCALFRSKVFPSSPFTDDSDSQMLSPPGSPRRHYRRLKRPSDSSSLSRASSVRTSVSQTRPSQEPQNTRLRSLSVSLEEEGARSRSASIGANTMQKRVLNREVSMTTTFKAKAEAKDKKDARASAAAKAKVIEERKKLARAESQCAKTREQDKGVMLVAATPVKPKAAKRRALPREPSQGSDGRTVPQLPSCDFGTAADVGSEEEDWVLPSSPDVLLLG